MGARRLRVAAVAALCAGTLGLTACTGSSPHYAQPTLRSTHAQPGPNASSPNSSRQSFGERCAARATHGARPIGFDSTRSQRMFCGVIWKTDTVPDCAKVAYGAKVIAFVHQHKCGTVRRVLATVYGPNFSVNLSTVTVRFARAGTAHNPFGTLFTFTHLAGSRSRGGIADLLRAGDKIPGRGVQPPANGYYGTDYLETRVELLYLWYQKRPPPKQHGDALKDLAPDLSFSALA